MYFKVIDEMKNIISFTRAKMMLYKIKEYNHYFTF